MRPEPGLPDIWFYTGQCSGVVASGPRSGITILFSFERGLDLRGDRLSEKQWQASDVWLAFRHSLCDKSVIGEPPNLTHNLALKRAAIGQLTGDIGSSLSAIGQFRVGVDRPTLPHP
jgi:hypothetical protein